MNRKKNNSEFKSRVALEALKGGRKINEIASQYDVHLRLVSRTGPSGPGLPGTGLSGPPQAGRS